MPWDRKRLLGYIETIQLLLGMTDKCAYISSFSILCLKQMVKLIDSHLNQPYSRTRGWVGVSVVE